MNKIVISTLLGIWLVVPTARAEVVDKIVASVNEDIITLSDVRIYKRHLSKGNFLDEILIPDEPTRKKVMDDEKALLQVIIDEKILDDEVKRQNLQATIEQVEQKIRNVTQRNRITRAELKQALSQQGSTFSEYQDFIRSQLERQNLIGKNVKSKIQVSDDEVVSAYLAKKPHGTGEVFEYNISHILFKTDGSGGEEGARNRVQTVLRKMKENKSFEALASEYSDDPKFTAGGALGGFKSGEMSKEFEDGVKNLQVGEVSGPIKTRFGIHLLKLNSKKMVADPKFEAEKESLRQALEETAYKKQFQFWLDQRRQEAIIRVNAT